MAFLPRVDNLIPNPSAEVNVTGWAGVSAGVTRDTSWAWVGTANFLVNASSALAQVGMTTPLLVADAQRVVIAAGSPASARATVRTTIAARRARIVIEWRNSSSAIISTDTGPWVNLTTNTDTLVTIEGLVAPALTVFASVRVEYGAQSGTLTIGNTMMVDGVQLSPTETVQTYADGSLGTGFVWLDTAHQSPSYRVAIASKQTLTRKGITRISAELWLANTNNEMIQEITAIALDGKISVNLNNLIKSAISLKVTDAEIITPYSSVIAPFLKITQDGITERHQLGLYITTPGKHTHRQTSTTGDIEGKDLLWILENDYVGANYSLAAGANIIAAASAIITAKGLRLSIPTSSATLSLAKTWPPDVSKLTIINDLLNAAGYYTLWADRQGVLRSQPYFELSTAHPALELFSGEGSVVIDAIEQDGVYDVIANQIIVYKENTQGTPIRVTRTNNDPASPVSTVSLGRIITRVIKDTNIADLATAKAIAKRAIEESSSYTNKLKVTTFPLPARELHEVYELAIYNDLGQPVGFGLWWCDAWELGFTLKSAKMTHNLKRLEPYGWDEVVG